MMRTKKVTDTDFVHFFEDIKNAIIYRATFTRGIFLVYIVHKYFRSIEFIVNISTHCDLLRKMWAPHTSPYLGRQPH